MITLADRVQGCIVAGAVGDVLGGPFEGRLGPLQFQETTRWSISDDSQLTLATCESIITRGKVSPVHIAEQFAQLFRARSITSVGASTLKALRDLDAGQHWALAGAKGERAAGNGAAMRIAPLAFLLNPANEHDRQLIRDVARITHHNEEAYVGALAVVIAIRSIAFGNATPTQLLTRIASSLPDSRVRDRIIELSILSSADIADVAARFGASGYVVESVPLALYASQFIDRYGLEDIIRMVIETGGDTDTNAAITAQILGTSIGLSQIPQRLVDRLPDVDQLKKITSEFSAIASALNT